VGRSAAAAGLAVAGAGGLLGAAACTASGANAGGRIDVVAAFYPLQFVAERVGGDAVAVSSLAKPGAEPHDLELNPRQLAQVADARLVLYLSGFQPEVDEAVANQARDRAFDVATVEPLLDAAGDHGHDAQKDDAQKDEGEKDEGEKSEADPAGTGGVGEKDPHVWLDPTRLATVADRVAERLAGVDPARTADYRAAATGLRGELEKLDREYADGLATCRRREIVVSHAAFGYLAERYDLEQVAITGLSPESEPSPRRLAEITEEARNHGATTIFFETLVDPGVAETIARQVGARTAVLDPLEGLPAGSTGDYFSVMRTNLDALRPALGCS
jgi:zinc transport system substrate-binding protein